MPTVSFYSVYVCCCGLGSGNLDFEAVRTNKQHSSLLGFAALNLEFCDLNL